jgi:hypothetical protein
MSYVRCPSPMTRTLLATIIAVAAALPATAAAVSSVPVMTGLDNPRGLSFGPQGALYVAEAGRGGDGPCVTVVQTVCYGPTGAVSRLWRGAQERVVTGLPSYALPGGMRAEGPNDVSLHGAGGAYVTIGLEADPSLRDQLAAGDAVWARFGRVVRLSEAGRVLPLGRDASPDASWHFVADLGGFEKAIDPEPRIVDSNPYGLLAEAGSQVVVDAGGNDLLRVSPAGAISVLAVLPPVPQARDHDAVPTSITVGPDGAYYVGELTGAPFADGAATVYRVRPGQDPEAFLTGCKAIIDIDFDAAGNLFVLQHATGATGLSGPGKLIRVAPDGTRTDLLTGLDRPTSVVVGPDGAVYITDHGLLAGIGEVLRVEPQLDQEGRP